MKNVLKPVLGGICGLLVVGASIQAQTIAQWTFETTFGGITGTGPTLAGIPPEIGVGSASGVHASTNTTWSSPAGNGSSHSFSANNWAVGDYWLFETTTVGYNNILVSYDQTSSNTGPGRGLLEYSTDGSLFTPVGAEYVILANASPNTPWNSTTYNPVYTFTYNLSGISSLNNAVAVYFRVVDTQTISASGGTVATAGTDRVDNFSVAVVPEPQGLLFFAGFCLLAWRRLGSRR